MPCCDRGRFDRQIVVDAPDVDGREAILKVHARGKKLWADVDLRRLAAATAGMSGADLANVLDEAALLTARRKANATTQRDLEDAVEKVVAGLSAAAAGSMPMRSAGSPIMSRSRARCWT